MKSCEQCVYQQSLLITPFPHHYSLSASTADGTCVDGTPGVDGNNIVCCASGCSPCAGSGCSMNSLPLGGDDCCGTQIKESGVYCDDSGTAPCIIGSDPDGKLVYVYVYFPFLILSRKRCCRGFCATAADVCWIGCSKPYRIDPPCNKHRNRLRKY